MPKILVVTHGSLAEAYREVLGMFFGDDAQEVVALGLKPDDSAELFGQAVRNAIMSMYTEEGVLIFVDVLSGTPFNTVAMAMHDLAESCPNLECLSGVNLPTLMEAFADRNDKSLSELHSQARQNFADSLADVREVLGL
ncbi:PTS sugar transporter subunit IIA [Olsenella sp. Marseille-QA0557]|uniref:PTS sugar transporter subunit IIA n=1 Tax=Olsenella sp. Marseille-QA0557 TaxID=3378782 RepID=UPI003D0CF2F6